MQTIIDLWRGDIAPMERCGAYDREGNLLAVRLDRLQTQLDSSITDAQKELLHEFIKQTDLLNLRMQELAFQEGFSLGSKLTAEALT